MDLDFCFSDCLLSALSNAVQKFSVSGALWLMLYLGKSSSYHRILHSTFWFFFFPDFYLYWFSVKTLNIGFWSHIFCAHKASYWHTFFFFFPWGTLFKIARNLENCKLSSKEIISCPLHSSGVSFIRIDNKIKFPFRSFSCINPVYFRDWKWRERKKPRIYSLILL